MREREQLRGDTIDTTAAFLAGWVKKHQRLERWNARFADFASRFAELSYQETIALRLGTNGSSEARHFATRLRERFLLRVAKSGRRLLRNVAGAERALEVPPKRANPEEIAESARRLGAFLKPKARRVFLDAGFEPDFWTNFDAARVALAAALKAQAQKQGAATKLSGRLRALIREARADMDVLSGVLEPLLAEDEVMRSAWGAARRIRHKLGRPTDAKLRRRSAAAGKSADATG